MKRFAYLIIGSILALAVLPAVSFGTLTAWAQGTTGATPPPGVRFGKRPTHHYGKRRGPGGCPA